MPLSCCHLHGLAISRDHGIEALNRRLPLIKGIAQIDILVYPQSVQMHTKGLRD